MTATIQLPACPVSVTQGTLAEWRVELSDYPATAWTLAYVFQSTKARVSVSGVADGAAFVVTLTAATTAAMLPDVYGWQAFASKSATSERYLVASGVLAVLPDFAVNQTPPADPRSHAAKALEFYNRFLVNEAIIKTLTPEQIEGLERVRRGYEWDVKRETAKQEAQAGGNPSRKVRVRFV